MRCLQQRGDMKYNIRSSQKEVCKMLSENIKAFRRSKGLSQEELALKLNVVRQTVSKWEQGLSVPDSDLLIKLSETLEVPVSTLLGETVNESRADDIKKLSEKLEVINLQLARRKESRRKALHIVFIAIAAATVVGFIILALLNSPYLRWDKSDPETAVFSAAYHVFEYLFVRISPFMLAAAIAGAVLTRRKA